MEKISSIYCKYILCAASMAHVKKGKKASKTLTRKKIIKSSRLTLYRASYATPISRDMKKRKKLKVSLLLRLKFQILFLYNYCILLDQIRDSVSGFYLLFLTLHKICQSLRFITVLTTFSSRFRCGQ